MRRAATGILLFTICRLALAVDPVQIRMRSVWEGMGPGQHRFPFLVTVKNNTGRDAVGQLQASGESDSVTIPLEVARGSTKEVPVYLSPGMPTTTVLFESNLGTYKVESNAFAEFANFRVATIGDISGLLGFLKTRRGPNGAVMSDPQLSVGHCRPEDAPDRVAGYFPLDALILSEGAERLSERQVEAIKQYVLQGGRVLIPGGANAPALSSPAWRNALPISDAAPKTFSSGVEVVDNTGVLYSIPRPITLMVGKPTTSSLVSQRTKGIAAATVRPIGLGSVVFLAYNPFEEPLESQPNRRQLVMDALKSAMYGIPYTRLHAVTLRSTQSEYDPYVVYSAPPSMPIERTTAQPANVASNGIYSTNTTFPSMSLADSPFNAKLIPSDKIGWTFVGFFFVVVPLNFLFLRLIKRLEWAWVSAPIFSLVFAGVLLSFAGNLYGAKLSRAFNGFIVQDLDTGLNAQWLKASYFFPRGGSYDLTLPNTDQVVSADFFSMTEYGYGRYGHYGERAGVSVPILDIGRAELPSVDVSNLAFREFTYHRVNTQPIDIKINVRNERGRLQGEVVNDSGLTLRCVALVHKNTTYQIPDLGPKKRYKLIPTTSQLPSSASLISGGRTTGQVALYAMTSNFDPGGLGELSMPSSKVVIVCTKELEEAR